MSGPPIPPDLWGRYPEDRRPVRRPAWLGGAGGLSGADLWRVETATRPMMLRAWPADGPEPARLDQIHRWLDQLRALPIVAAPIAGQDRATWYPIRGRSWELAPLVPGRADLDRPPTEPHLAAMFATLARVHLALTTDRRRGPSPGLLARAAELDRLIAGEFATLRLAVDRPTAVGPRGVALRWLALARAAAPGVAAPLRRAAAEPLDLRACLRDVRPDHFLFEGDRPTGLVDFGAMGVDSAATDLARLLGETVGHDPRLRDVAIGAYAAARPLDAAERDAIAPFEAANALLGGARWVRWHFIDHRRFAAPDAAARGLGRTLDRLEAWLGRPAALRLPR